ncbi:hypothetical protein HD554DRAFT_623111 [Boletus coccyginus]|nr:hypothetical protein HD554DRAFT_623111 [Boletus coccyginus]
MDFPPPERGSINAHNQKGSSLFFLWYIFLVLPCVSWSVDVCIILRLIRHVFRSLEVIVCRLSRFKQDSVHHKLSQKLSYTFSFLATLFSPHHSSALRTSVNLKRDDTRAKQDIQNVGMQTSSIDMPTTCGTPDQDRATRRPPSLGKPDPERATDPTDESLSRRTVSCLHLAQPRVFNSLDHLHGYTPVACLFSPLDTDVC